MSYFKEFLSRIWSGLVSAFDLKPLGHWSFWLSVGSFGLNLFFSTDKGAALLSQVTANMTPADGLKLGLALLVAAILTKFVKQATVMGWLKSLSAWLSGFIKANGGAAGRNLTLSLAGAALLALVGPVAYERLHIDVPANEGTIQKGYLDPAGIPTKCTGDTTDVVVGKVYTDEECRVSLDKQLLAHAQPVVDFAPDLTQHPYILASAIDFTYNVGPSAFRNGPVGQNFKSGHYAAACKAMNENPTGRPQYVFAGKVKICRKQPVVGEAVAFCLYKGQVIDGNLCLVRGQTFLKSGVKTKTVCDMQPRALPGLVKRRADNRALCERGLDERGL